MVAARGVARGIGRGATLVAPRGWGVAIGEVIGAAHVEALRPGWVGRGVAMGAIGVAIGVAIVAVMVAVMVAAAAVVGA